MEDDDCILDAFALCGHSWSQFQSGFQWEKGGVIEQVGMMEELVPCMVCRQIAEDGWVQHALDNHCGGRRISMQQLRLYRLSCGEKCVICNFTYANDEERDEHINLHMTVSFGPDKTFPLRVANVEEDQSIHERAIRLKTFLYFNCLKERIIYLYMMIPSCLEGQTLKEKLSSVQKLTYIPITISSKIPDNFPNEIRKTYDMYRVVLHDPDLDETFSGINYHRRMYGKIMIRVLASIKQEPERLKHIKFLMYKSANGSLFMIKHLVEVTDEDINEVIQDVLVNHRTIVCAADLFDEQGCVDPHCTCLVHFGVNVSLILGASHPTQRFISLKRYHDSRFELGTFELVTNPPENVWMEYAAEIITKRRYYIVKPVPHFVYLVLCCYARNITELPSIGNAKEWTEKGQLSVYVGLSYLCGIPPHHFKGVRVNVNNNEEEDDDNNEVLEDENDGTGFGKTELSKLLCPGRSALYMIRNSLKRTYQDAEKLEAAVQLYGMLATEHAMNNEVNIINKRLEKSALSFCSLPELEDIICLIDAKINLFYDSPALMEAEFNERGLQQINWGLFERPYFLNEIIELPKY